MTVLRLYGVTKHIQRHLVLVVARKTAVPKLYNFLIREMIGDREEMGGGHARLLLPILTRWGHKTLIALLVDLVFVVNGHSRCVVCGQFLIWVGYIFDEKLRVLFCSVRVLLLKALFDVSVAVFSAKRLICYVDIYRLEAIWIQQCQLWQIVKALRCSQEVLLLGEVEVGWVLWDWLVRRRKAFWLE